MTDVSPDRAILKSVSEVTQEITRELDLTRLLELICRRAAHLMGTRMCTVYLWDEKSEILTPQAWSNRPEWLKDMRLRLGEGIVGIVAERREGLIINDYQSSPHALPQVAEQIGQVAGIAEPLLYRDRLIGVITTSSEGSGHHLTDQDRELLAVFAAQAAIAIENARLFEEVRQQTDHLVKINVELQNEIAERQRAEEELKRTTDELARSNAELEQFAYVASHDLQEPLRMISSYLQLLKRRYQGKLEADADEFIAFAVDGASRMQTMINDLLTYSRVGTRSKPLVPTNCEEVLSYVLNNLQIAIEECQAAITHEALPTVMADPTQLGQLFQNLISNAIKFRDDKPPEVSIRVIPNGVTWLFSVKDNGIGLDPEDGERIFQIFQRLHGRGEYPGTGIGLAVCRRIVERHGGRIWVESQPGVGASFLFTIPRMPGDSVS